MCQLSLHLQSDTQYKYKVIPEGILDQYELCDKAPSGLRHRKNQKAAGSKLGNYYSVGYKGKTYYAHRVIWMIKNGGKDPGRNVVRHFSEFDNHKDLLIGTQKDNKADTRGSRYRTKNMFIYKGKEYNLRALCLLLGLKYTTVYRRCKHFGHDYIDVFKGFGFDVQRA